MACPRAWLLVVLVPLAACAGTSDVGQPASRPATQAATRPASGPAPAPGPKVRFEFQGSTLPEFVLRRPIADLLEEFAANPARLGLLVDAAADLREFLVGEARPDARVDHAVLAGEETVVRFTIDEGPVVTIARLELHGAAALPAGELRKLLRARPSGLFGTGDPYFVAAEIADLATAIAVRYRAGGFLDVRVAEPDIRRAPRASEAEVVIRIEEGPRYTVAEVAVAESLRVVPLPPEFATARGRACEAEVVAALRLALRTALEDHGHPDPRVVTRLRLDPSRAQAVVVFEGTPGARATIAAVEIRGGEGVSRGLIQRRLEFQAGQPFHGGRIQRSLRALYETGVFRSAQVLREPVDGDPTRLRLVVDLEEGENRSVSFLAGVGSYEYLRGAVTYEDRNFLGHAQRLVARVKGSVRGYGGDLTWTEPDLLRSGVALSLRGFGHVREEPSFTDQTAGTTVALARPLGQHQQARIGYTFGDRRALDVDPSVQLGADSAVREGKVFLELSRDTRDSPLYPASGHVVGVKYEHSDPALGGNLRLDRLTVSGILDLPLGQDFLVSLSAQTGAVWFGDPGVLPVQERFFNGGETTVRSFREGQLGPQAASGDPLGGEFRNVLNAELRFPILGPLHGSLFADAGNVGVDLHEYGLSDLRYAVGGGLRFALPVGPLRLDLGVNPDRRPGEEAYVLHFTIGFPF